MFHSLSSIAISKQASITTEGHRPTTRLSATIQNVRSTCYIAGPLFTKISTYWYRDSHYNPEAEMVIRPSDVYMGIPQPGSHYWNYYPGTLPTFQPCHWHLFEAQRSIEFMYRCLIFQWVADWTTGSGLHDRVPGGRLNIKMSSYQYREPHVKYSGDPL